MKKTISFFLSLSVVFCLAACGGQGSTVSVAESQAESTVSSAIESEKSEGAQESETESKEESKAESKSESKEESKAEGKTESKQESKAESKSESKEETDNSAYQDYYEYEGVSFKVPDGFHADDESGSNVIFYHEDFPQVADNITLATSDETVDIYTEENVNRTLGAFLSDFDKCRNYNKYTIDGYDAVRYTYDVTTNGVEVTQTQVICFLDSKAVMLAFTGVTGENDAAFEEAVNSIRVLNGL